MACSQWIPNLLDKIRWIWVLAYLLCTCLFMFQLIQILPNYFSPTLTHTEVKEVPLRDMDFPLDFKICLRPSAFNETALKELGYGDSGHYILGKSKFNESIHIIGWGGHSSNESSLVKNASEVLNAVKSDWTKQPLVSYVWVTTNSGDIIDNLALNVRLENINWITECLLLYVSTIEQETERGMKGIGIFLNETLLTYDVSLELKLQGKNMAAHRVVQDDFFYHTGDNMIMNKYSNYRVQIEKKVLIESDPGTTCRNYPNRVFQSYLECDDKYMRDRLDRVAPGLNLMPVWMTKDLSKVTIEPVVANLQILGALENLFFGTDASDCPLPCETFSTETKLTSTTSSDYAGFGLTFKDTVEVSTTKMMRPTFFSFLSEVGGSLGLWLGLGALQVLQQMINTTQSIFEKLHMRGERKKRAGILVHC